MCAPVWLLRKQGWAFAPINGQTQEKALRMLRNLHGFQTTGLMDDGQEKGLLKFAKPIEPVIPDENVLFSAHWEKYGKD